MAFTLPLQGIPFLVGAVTALSGTTIALGTSDKATTLKIVAGAALVATVATALFMVVSASFGAIAAGAAVGALYGAVSMPFNKKNNPEINDKNGVAPGQPNYISTRKYNNKARFVAGVVVGAGLGALAGLAATQYGAQAMQLARTHVVPLFPVLASL